MRRRGLGFISLVVTATGGPTNPVGIAVFAASIAAAVLGKFLKHGQGRKEADYLTNPGTGAQWILEHETLPELLDIEYEGIKAAGALTPHYVETVIQALEKIRDGFFDYVEPFKRAGPGARETIRHVIDDILLPDKREDLRQLTAGSEKGGAMHRLWFNVPEGAAGPGVGAHIASVSEDGARWAWFLTYPELEDFARAQGETLAQLSDFPAGEDEAAAIVAGDMEIPTGLQLSSIPAWVWAGGAWILFKTLVKGRKSAA